jgi:hypothetical protein
MKPNRPPIKFDQIGIGGILRRHNLRVPSHQRDYSWTDKEVTNLFQDLAKAIADDEQEYFLGTIVTIPDENGILEVIDGQQRLATVTILLSQIRAYLIGKDDVIVQDLNHFLNYTDRTQRATLPKLRLNLVDNAYFGEMLSDDKIPQPQRISHRLLSDAFKKAMEYVLKIVSTTDVKQHGDILNKWISFLEDGAEVILLQIPTGANAYKMFETLNDRGLRTTQADLVKNYLFSQAGDHLPEAQSSWSAMRSVLESIQEEGEEDITVTFLRHILIIMRGILKTNEVYDAVQNRAKGSKNAIAFLKEIETWSSIYVSTFQFTEKWLSYPDSALKALETLNFFNIHPFRPAMLAVAGKFSPQEASKAFQMFISLGVRLLIASSTRSGSIEETLGTAANKTYKWEITTAKQLKEEISNIIPSDEVFRLAFETATISKASLARYYLRSLEKVAKKEPVPWFVVNDDKEVITLEHVLPANTEGNWPQFTQESAEAYYRRLGNMILLSRKANSDLKSSGFDEKKKMYKDCPYELTRQIETANEWSAETINKRQKKLAELALSAWPL